MYCKYRRGAYYWTATNYWTPFQIKGMLKSSNMKWCPVICCCSPAARFESKTLNLKWWQSTLAARILGRTRGLKKDESRIGIGSSIAAAARNRRFIANTRAKRLRGECRAEREKREEPLSRTTRPQRNREEIGHFSNSACPV